MRPALRCRAALIALLSAFVSASAGATDSVGRSDTPLIYGFTGDPAAEQLLLAARWATPSLSLRLDTAAGLGAHEVRVLSAGSTLRWGPQQASFAGAEPLADVNIDPVRATYRYTLLEEPNWAMKFGLSANLGEPAGGLRLAPGAERTSFGSLPLVHLAGVGQWSQRWRLAFALDGLATGRGRAVDLGMQVDYLWSPSMSIFGGYQVTEAAGEAESYYGPGLSNRANVGLRYRF
jgi:hypothetical protein